MIEDIDTVLLHVKDLRQMRRFYRDVLGLNVVDDGSEFVNLKCGDIMIGLEKVDEEFEEESAMRRKMSLVLNVTKFDRLVRVLREAGIPIRRGPVLNREAAVQWLTIEDPEGHELILQEYTN